MEEYRSRYDSVYQRKLVLRRDRGRCRECSLDTVRLANEVRLAWKSGKRREALDLLLGAGFKDTDLRWKARGLIPLWQADHIVPVVEGGGGTTLENLRTLCLCCHRKATRELMARRRALRKAERDALKATEKAAKAKPAQKPKAVPRPPAKPTRFKWTGVRPKPKTPSE